MGKYERYNFFGISISSEVPLTVIGKREYRSNNKGDVHISVGEIPSIIKKESISEPGYYAEGDTICYAVPEVGWFKIECGEKIVVNSLRKVESSVVELYLVGICMATVLRQRKYIVLHGSCVHVKGKTIMFAGKQGSGKSTLAAASTKCGAKIVSDDICPVRITPSGAVKVFPGHSQVKLWPESIDMLGYEKGESYKLHSDVEKRYVLVDENISSGPLTLDIFCKLSKGPEFLAKEIEGGTAFEAVCRNLFLRRIPQPSSEKARQFRDMCKMIEAIKVYDLQRKSTDSPVATFRRIVNRLAQK